jgi:hypothetical protein
MCFTNVVDNDCELPKSRIVSYALFPQIPRFSPAQYSVMPPIPFPTTQRRRSAVRSTVRPLYDGSWCHNQHRSNDNNAASLTVPSSSIYHDDARNRRKNNTSIKDPISDLQSQIFSLDRSRSKVVPGLVPPLSPRRRQPDPRRQLYGH